jgi:hypothetical protein
LAEDATDCFGREDPETLLELNRDGFVEALTLPFDQGRVLLQLYWRPHDSRARVFIETKDRAGRPRHFCTPLKSLKIIRDRSILQLCQVRRNGNRYVLWARLRFMLYERMVLFYCTFVAMKHQDPRPFSTLELLDNFELAEGYNAERELFGGCIRHGDLQHALRLFEDPGSGVIRIEACALRGPMKDVPLWTAFITRNANDPDWAYHEGGGIVSLAVLRPPPYVFLVGYEPPRNPHDPTQYLLHFTTRNGNSTYS